MKFHSFIFLFVLLLIVSSCIDEKKISFNEVEVTTEGNSIVSINIPKAEGDISISEAINKTINDIVSNSLSFGKENLNPEKSLEEQIEFFNNEFYSFKKDFPDNVQEWEAQVDGDIMYQSPEIISIAISSYQYTGGAHGILTISFLNFDATTGLRLETAELFSDIEAIKPIAKAYYTEFITENESDVFNKDEFLLPQNIGFEEEGIVMLYNVYEVAPYATGIIQFTIPYSEISTYLNFN